MERTGSKSNRGVEEIKDGDEIIAIIIKADYQGKGVQFLSPPRFSQQLGFLQHPAGKVIESHVHNPVPREVIYTQEVLLIRKGKAKVNLYKDDREFLTSRVLEVGDVILLAGGGHGFDILEDTEMIEVKQGPYSGEDDKTHF